VRAQNDEWFIQNPTLYIINVSAAGMCLVAALSCMLAFGHRLLKARRSGKVW